MFHIVADRSSLCLIALASNDGDPFGEQPSGFFFFRSRDSSAVTKFKYASLGFDSFIAVPNKSIAVTRSLSK